MSFVKKLTTIEAILSQCIELSKNLNTLCSIHGTQEELEKRKKIFDESGIHKYGSYLSIGIYYDRYSKNGLNYKINELSNPIKQIYFDKESIVKIDDRDDAHIVIGEGVDKSSKMKYTINLEMSRKKWLKKYAHLKKGDKIMLNGPVEVFYKNGYSNMANEYEKKYKQEEYWEYWSSVSITIHM